MSARGQALGNTLFSSVGIYTEYVLGMVTSIVIARHLGPTDYGAYSLAIWLVATAVAVTNAGATSAVIKFVAELRGAGRDGLIRPLLAWLRRVQRGCLAVVLIVGTGLFLNYGDHVMPDLQPAVLLAVLMLATWLRAGYMFDIGVLKGYENFRATAAVVVLVTPLNLLLVLAAWWLDGPMAIFLGVFAVTSLAFWWAARRQVARVLPPPGRDARLDPDLRRRVWTHVRLVAVTVAVAFVSASEIEVLFLTIFDTAAAAGQFKVAFQLATGAALLVPGVFAALLLPMMANALSQGRAIAGRRLAVSTSYLTLLAVPLVAYGTVFAGSIIAVLYGPAYAPAGFALACCLASVAIGSISQGASSYLLSADRQRAHMYLVIAVGVVKITLDLLLVVRYGLVGAVAAYSIANVLGALTLIAMALRIAGVALQWRRLRGMVLAGVAAALVAWVSTRGLPALPSLVLGLACVVVVYLVATILLGCWQRSDIEHLQDLYARIARGRQGMPTRILAWAWRRSGPAD